MCIRDRVKKGLELPYTPPCINRSNALFDVAGGALVYALGALKNVGVDAMRLITDGRRQDGVEKPFATVFDFARRVDLKRVGKRPLEMLARAGAFDQLDPNRRRMHDNIEIVTNYSAAIFEQKASDQVSLFGDAGEDLPEPRLANVEDWLPAERLTQEQLAIGFYLSGHPLDDYMAPLKRKGILSLDELTDKTQSGPLVAKLAGVVAGRQERKSAKGNRFAFVQLSDVSGAYEVTLFSETLEKSREYLEPGAKVVITVEATLEADQLKLLGRSVAPVDVAVADAGASGLRVFIDKETTVPAVASVLEQSAKEVKSGAKGPIYFCLMDPALPGEVEIDTGREFPVTPQVKGAIKSLGGVLEVEEV